MTDLVQNRTAPDLVRRRTAAGSTMSRTVVNFWLDCVLAVTFVLLCWVSAVLQFLFPAGVDAAGWTLWGGTADDWRNIQFGVLCTLGLGIVLHVMLHWSWVCGVVATKLLGRKSAKDDASQTLWGVGTLVVVLHLLAGGLIAAWACLQRSGTP